MAPPRLQHVPWLWRIVSFEEQVIITDAGLAIEVYISVRDAANVAQVQTAIGGGGGGGEPEDMYESIEG